MLRFDQIRFLTSNMAACVRFYRDTLGLKLNYGSETDVYSSFVVTDGITVAFFDSQLMADAISAPLVPVQGDQALLNFTVDNLDETMKTLSANGVVFVAPATTHEDWGMRTAHFRDPEGRLLEISEGLPQNS